MTATHEVAIPIRAVDLFDLYAGLAETFPSRRRLCSHLKAALAYSCANRSGWSARSSRGTVRST